MAQVTKQSNPVSSVGGPARAPATPRQAAERRAPLDKHLDAELFKALADPTRLNLLACLVKCGRGCTTTEIAECCSVDFSVVSRHLSVLASAGVIESVKQGRTVWHTPRTKQLAETLRALSEAVDECDRSGCECCGEACGVTCCNEPGGKNDCGCGDG